MSVNKVLTDQAPIGLQILQTSLQKVNVTGKTVASVKFIIDKLNQKLTYLGRPFISTIETYRGPRNNSENSNFKNNLEEWLKAKGFQSKTSKKGIVYYKIGDNWFSSKSLAWKINKEGNSKWKGGEKVRDVYSEAMGKFKEDLIEAIKEDQKLELKNKVKEQLK